MVDFVYVVFVGVCCLLCDCWDLVTDVACVFDGCLNLLDVWVVDVVLVG